MFLNLVFQYCGFEYIAGMGYYFENQVEGICFASTRIGKVLNSEDTKCPRNLKLYHSECLQNIFLQLDFRSNNIPQRSLKTYICIGLTIFFIYNFSKYDIKIRATYLAKQFHEFFAQCAHSIQFRAQFSNLNQYRKLQNN